MEYNRQDLKKEFTDEQNKQRNIHEFLLGVLFLLIFCLFKKRNPTAKTTILITS